MYMKLAYSRVVACVVNFMTFCSNNDCFIKDYWTFTLAFIVIPSLMLLERANHLHHPDHQSLATQRIYIKISVITVHCSFGTLHIPQTILT